jgi:hypothetical protein
MVQPKYNPQESLERIKLMMNYDTSKTLNENRELINEEYHWLLPNGTVTAGSALVGRIPRGARAFSSLAAARTAAAALSTGVAAAGTGAAAAGTGAAAAGGGLSMAGVGAAALTALPWVAGAAVVGGLGYWLYDSINNGMPTAAKVESFFNSCSTQAKNLKQVASDAQITSAAEKINASIEGIGTNEDDIKSAIESMGNVADLCALKTKYDARYGSLYEDLDSDIDGTDWKTYVWAPMQTIIEKSAEKIEEVKPKKENDGGGGGSGGYKACKGTYSKGCISDVISTVQSCVGLVTDGKYGSKTEAKLKELGYNSFSDADVDKICNKQLSPVSPETPEISGEEITSDSTDLNF